MNDVTVSKIKMTYSGFVNFVARNLINDIKSENKENIIIAVSYNNLVFFNTRKNYVDPIHIGRDNKIIAKYKKQYLEHIGRCEDYQFQFEEMFDGWHNFGNDLIRRIAKESESYFGIYFDLDDYPDIIRNYINIDGKAVNILTGEIISDRHIPFTHYIKGDLYTLIKNKIHEFVVRMNNEFLTDPDDEKETDESLLQYFQERAFEFQRRGIHNTKEYEELIDNLIHRYYDENYEEEDEDLDIEDFDDDEDEDDDEEYHCEPFKRRKF